MRNNHAEILDIVKSCVKFCVANPRISRLASGTGGTPISNARRSTTDTRSANIEIYCPVNCPRIKKGTLPWAIFRFRIFSNYFSQKFEKIKITVWKSDILTTLELQRYEKFGNRKLRRYERERGSHSCDVKISGVMRDLTSMKLNLTSWLAGKVTIHVDVISCVYLEYITY